MKHLPVWLVIGVIDSYDALHFHKVLDGERAALHDDFWPHIHHKRWRFKVRDWELDTSIMTKGSLTEEDCERVEALMRKILVVPEWVRRGDAWVAAGRPHGKAAERFSDAWHKAERERRLLAAAKEGSL